MLGAARRPNITSTGGTINAYGNDHRQNTITRSDTKRSRPPNLGSRLLTTAENQLMFEILGPNRISLVAAVVQLLRASRGQWQHVQVGVVSLVKDYERKLYALMLFDIYNGNKLWEQVLYKNFSTKSYPNCRKLLSFEGDDCVYGFNFSDEQEAYTLKDHLDKRQESERGSSQKEIRPNQIKPITNIQTPKAQHQQGYNQKFQSPGFTDVGSTPHFAVSHVVSTPAASKKKNKDQKKKKTKISKEDIGFPTNFEHKAHLGWNSDGGFNQHTSAGEPMDESVRELLKAVGYNPENMSSGDVKFACEFIDKYKETPGNIPPYSQNTLTRNDQTGFTLTPGQKYQPQQHYTYQAQPQSYSMPDNVMVPPPAPARDSSIYAQQKQQPVRPPPIERPPPPTSYQKPAVNYERSYQPPSVVPAPPQIPSSQNTTNVQISAPRPAANAPMVPPMQNTKPKLVTTSIPPPPPPLPNLNATPASNTPASTANQNVVEEPAPSDGRANLLAEIQAGRKLKSVGKPVEKSGFTVGSAAKVSERDQMLQQIKDGPALKHIDSSEVENRKSVPNVKDLGGIAGALARALEERRKNICISDESDNSDANDSEWEDD